MATPSENVEKEMNFCIVEATVATGFEQTAREEVIEKLGVEVKSARGKISIRAPISVVPRILRLGTIDHCRVVIKNIRGFEFPKDEFTSLQRMRELVKEVDWVHGISVWNQIFSFDHPIDASHENASGNIGNSETKEKITLTKKSTDKKSKRKGGRGKDKKKNEKENRGTAEKAKDIEGQSQSDEKTSKDAMPDVSPEAIESPEKNSDIEGKRNEIPGSIPQAEDLPEDQAASIDDNDETPESDRHIKHPESEESTINEEARARRSTPGPTPAGNQIESETKSAIPTEGCSQTECPVKIEDEQADVKVSSPVKIIYDPTKPKFRVTCNRVGENHKFDSTNMAANFGGAIYCYFGWGVDLKNFDIEVILHIDWDEVSVCIALTKESLHKRLLTNFGVTTLRPTIAYNMLRLCEIQYGDVVCDPMCGTGSIPISAGVSWPNAVHLCGEIYSKAIEKTYNNLINLNIKKESNQRRLVELDIYQWDVTNLPLRDECIDVFITDLPFGKRFGSKSSNHKLYPLVLEELARVTRKDTGRACFITEDKKCMVKLIQESRLWQRRKVLSINLGGLETGVYLLHRTSEDIEKLTEETPEVMTKKRQDRAEAQKESRRKILEDIQKLSRVQNKQTSSQNKEAPAQDKENKNKERESQNQKDINAKDKQNDEISNQNKDTGAQTLKVKRSTHECSSQVSETNISSSETSSQTLESGSPRKRQKIESLESESQTTGKARDVESTSAKGFVQSNSETRSQMTETSNNTAEIGSQIGNNVLVTSETGIQAESENISSDKAKTRSQSSGTTPCETDSRSQSTDTRKIMAETGSQATTTRNTSTFTGAVPVRTSSTETDSNDVASESGVQVIESTTLKVDTGLQVGPSVLKTLTPGSIQASELKKSDSNAEKCEDEQTDPTNSNKIDTLISNTSISPENTSNISTASATESSKNDAYQKKDNTCPPEENESCETVIESASQPIKCTQEESTSLIDAIKENRLTEIKSSDLKNDSYVDVKMPDNEFASCVDTGAPKKVLMDVNSDAPSDGDTEKTAETTAIPETDKEKGCKVL